MTSAIAPAPQAEVARASDRVRSWAWRLAMAGMAIGTLIRLEHLLGGRSVHIDEARLALNIGQRSFGGLLQPLSYEQSAPIPFLWIEKVAALIGGVNEIALRFVPFVLGCALLIVMYHLARRILPEAGVSLTVALAAVSPVLVHYSNEIKPYIGDALLVACLTVLAIDLVATPTRRQWLKFAAVGSVAVVASTPAILALLGLGGVVILACRTRAPWMALRMLIALAVWLVVFGLLYFAFYRVMSSHPYMRQFWEPAFLTADGGPLLPRAWGMLSELTWGTFMGGYVHGVRARNVMLAAGLATATISMIMLAGVVQLRRMGGGTTVALLLAPAAVTVVACIAGAYPISLRLVLYLVPSVLVLVVAGALFTIQRATPLRASLILGVLSLALLTRPFLRSAVPVFWPYHRQELRPLIIWLEERGAGEPVYVFANAVPAWVFYTTDWARPDTARLNWYSHVARAGGPAFENAAPRPGLVKGEGVGLEYRYRGRKEVVGVSTGEQWRVIVGSKWRRPDPGWAVNEARRVIAAAQPSVWLVFSHFRGSENGLLDRIEGAGLRQTDAEVSIGAHVFRYTR